MKLGRKIWEIILPTTTLARTPGREGEIGLVCRIIKVFDSGHKSGIEMVSHGGLFGRMLWLGPRELGLSFGSLFCSWVMKRNAL